jgi:hypothetical protein
VATRYPAPWVNAASEADVTGSDAPLLVSGYGLVMVLAMPVVVRGNAMTW